MYIQQDGFLILSMDTNSAHDMYACTSLNTEQCFPESKLHVLKKRDMELLNLRLLVGQAERRQLF